ncbi:hypothetical protein OC834_005763, partial [Tilletia horrida]
MLSFVKKHTGKLAILVLASQLVSSAIATPFDAEEETVALWVRAQGGKYIGSNCTSSSECYSTNCVYSDATGLKQCQRQPTGGPCFERNNCVSRNCQLNTGKCDKLSGLYGPCKTPLNCDARTQALTCAAGSCKLKNKAACASDAQCISGSCKKGVCQQVAQGPNTPCSANRDCRSGKCQASSVCVAENGSSFNCGFGYSYCTRYPLGHTCANDGECGRGFCRNGICTPGKNGDACFSSDQCAGRLTCGKDKKCYNPAMTSSSTTSTSSSSSSSPSATASSSVAATATTTASFSTAASADSTSSGTTTAAPTSTVTTEATSSAAPTSTSAESTVTATETATATATATATETITATSTATATETATATTTATATETETATITTTVTITSAPSATETSTVTATATTTTVTVCSP